MVIEDILKRNKTPIIVGGTGLYISASLYDYKFEKETYNNNYEIYSNEEIYQKLLEIDPQTDIHPNNRKRMIRALNYYENTNQVFSQKETTNELLYDTLFIGLTTDRKILYDRINKRVDIMLENGLLEEAKKIYDTGIRTKAVMTPIGYKELFEYFDGLITLEEAINKIKQRSRNYAKRQYTWFRNKMSIKWFDVNFKNFDSTIEEVTKYIMEEGNYEKN